MEDHVCPPDHKHGETSTCYGGHHCRCVNCRRAHADRMDRRRRTMAYGRWEPALVDGTSTRIHIAKLRHLGWTLEPIAAAAGVKHSTILRISSNNREVLRTTRDAVLAIPVVEPDLMAWGRVDPTGTRRRLQALMFMGWSGAHLERRLGKSPRSLSDLMKKPAVTAVAADAVKTLYDELWTVTPNPSNGFEQGVMVRTKRWARRNGWVGPLHWDDIDTDPEPAAVVAEPFAERFDEQAVADAIAGEQPNLSAREKREVVTVLNERRWSARMIADHIGCNKKTVERIRAELNLPIYLYNDTTYRKVA